MLPHPFVTSVPRRSMLFLVDNTIVSNKFASCLELDATVYAPYKRNKNGSSFIFVWNSADLSGILFYFFKQNKVGVVCYINKVIWFVSSAHWLNKLAAILQTTFWNAFSGLILCEFRIKLYGSVLMIGQDWFPQWLDAKQKNASLN